MLLGSWEVGEVVGCTAGSKDAAVAVLDHGTVDWDPGEDTLNLFQLRGLGPVLYPCLFAPGGGSLAPGSPDVEEGEAVSGAPVD